MSEIQTAEGQALIQHTGDAPVPRARVQYTPVASAMGIMDTARFEHLGRVAQVMARAGLMPMTLTHEKQPGASDNSAPVPLPHEVVVARAYLIANQADLWNADPNAVAQCTSIVHGKLMYEGKLVHGILSAKLGVDLMYEFGRYDQAARDIKGSRREDGEWVGEMPGPDDQGLGVRVLGTLPGEARPRWIAGSVAMWHKGAKSPWQAATAWPRQLRYMGAREWCRAYKPSLLLGIITDDEVEEYDMARQAGAIAPAAPQMLHAGFTDVRPAQLESPPPRRRRNADKAAEITQRMESAPIEGEKAPPAAEEQTPGASEPETATAAQAASEALEGDNLPGTVLGIEDGHAESGEGLDGMGNRLDGSAPEEAEEQTDETQAQGDEVLGDGGEQQQDDDLPAEFRQYIGQVEEAKSWGEVKKAMAAFYQTGLFKGMNPDQQNKIRANTWDAVAEKAMPDKPDQGSDASAFRLWIEWCDDADAIAGTLAVLEREASFAQKEPSFKDAIRRSTAGRIERLA